VKRWLLLVPVFLAGLFVALQATAAVKDGDVKATLSAPSAGQYNLYVENIGTVAVTSFTFTAGSALKITSIVSTDTGSCTLTNATSFTCSVTLGPPPCACHPGGSVNVLFAGSGDWGGSVVKANTTTLTLGTAPAATTPTTTTTATPPTTTTTAKPPAKKVIPKCKKGHKSTKAHPCHK
jgi:hypothetical protein